MGTGLSRPGNRRVAKAIRLAIVLPIVLVGYAGYQAPSASQSTFSVDVALVVLHATVTDRQGIAVSNLVESDFEVSENGVRQHIQLFKNEDIPVAVGLAIDHSTSMVPKLAEVVTAARGFVRSSNRQDEMFVVNFNEKASLGLPPKVRFTDDTVELERAIMTELARGQTALYDAIAMGLDRLRTASRDKKALIVISDGGDNASRLKLEQVMNLAEQSSAVIYTVGVFDEDDEDQNPGVLKRLALATGGEAFLPHKLGEVTAICERIARDIRHQYTIGYIPSNAARDGSYRTIRVHARTEGQGKLSVRTRAGYIAGSESKIGGQGAK
jgi:VWFA-related protein